METLWEIRSNGAEMQLWDVHAETVVASVRVHGGGEDDAHYADAAIRLVRAAFTTGGVINGTRVD